MDVTVAFTVNGQDRSLTTDAQRSLLDVLREDLGLLGTKYACGEGQCGACTVLVDGRAVRSCVTPVSRVSGSTIVTIEGLASGKTLHPIQQAFLEEGALQCGYCTSGMILEAVALLEAKEHPSERDIVTVMNGHICRCNGYPKIVRAIRRAGESMKG